MLTDSRHYKLILLQRGKLWEWYLQPTEPDDLPFSFERVRYSGRGSSVKLVLTQVHDLIPREQVDYIYMDRIESNLCLDSA